MNKKVRTRIAPSPTGYATIGNIRTALFCYLYAKRHGGEFILRIEDTDKTRFVDGAEKYIIDSLKWLGISPDDGVNYDGTAKYRQSEREYRSYVDILLASGDAYYAFDTSEDLDIIRKKAEASKSVFSYNSVTRVNMKNSISLSSDEVKSRLESGELYTIRFKTPRNREIIFKDLVKGVVKFNTNNMDDKILFKSDNTVAFHLANVVDDYKMEITHVIRGDEWLSSTPLHILIYEAFGWDKPEFCHLPLVLGPDGKKLSKRKMKEYGFPVFPLSCSYLDDNGKSVHVTGFKDENYEPDALINFLALLGWNPGGNKEFMTMDEMISLFELERINNSGAMFDIEKLKNFNAHYLRSRDSEDLFIDYIFQYVPDSFNGEYGVESCIKIANIAKERSIFRTDLYKAVSYFFEPVILKDDVVLKNDAEFRQIMEAMKKGYLSAESSISNNWMADFIKHDIESFCEKFGFKIGKVLLDLRLALTGGIPGPDLPTTMEVLGKDESFKRIENLLEKTKKVAD